MTISICIKGREEMTEKIIIKPSVQKRFDSFMVHGRVLFFSAPCGFGKTVLADALLRGRNVLRQSAADPDCAIPPSAQDWDILLIDDLQLMQEEAGQQALFCRRAAGHQPQPRAGRRVGPGGPGKPLVQKGVDRVRQTGLRIRVADDEHRQAGDGVAQMTAGVERRAQPDGLAA